MPYPVSAHPHIFPTVAFHQNPLPARSTCMHALVKSAHAEQIHQRIHFLTQDSVATKQTCQNLAQSVQEIRRDMHSAIVEVQNLVQYTSAKSDECVKQEHIRASDVQRHFEATLGLKLGEILKIQQQQHTALIDHLGSVERRQLQQHDRAPDARRDFETSCQLKIDAILKTQQQLMDQLESIGTAQLQEHIRFVDFEARCGLKLGEMVNTQQQNYTNLIDQVQSVVRTQLLEQMSQLFSGINHKIDELAIACPSTLSPSNKPSLDSARTPKKRNRRREKFASVDSHVASNLGDLYDGEVRQDNKSLRTRRSVRLQNVR